MSTCDGKFLVKGLDKVGGTNLNLRRPAQPERDAAGPDSIDIGAWRDELAPIYPASFLADRSDAEIVELVRALGRLGVELPAAGEKTSSPQAIRRRTAEDRKRKFLDEAVAIEQTSAQEAGMLGYMARVLVQATMPHSATAERQFFRTNGNLTISITAQVISGCRLAVIRACCWPGCRPKPSAPKNPRSCSTIP